MKIYTKTGDQGTTSLVNGTRVSKDDIRIEAYGTIDELMVAECLLATDDNSELKKQLPQMLEEDVNFIEKFIDEMNSQLEPLNRLIIPGGNIRSSRCHVCRTVCRRAERNVVRMSRDYDVNPLIMKYLNRLSDMFFVMSRVFSEKDQRWNPEIA